jgi:hypothetical protein
MTKIKDGFIYLGIGILWIASIPFIMLVSPVAIIPVALNFKNYEEQIEKLDKIILEKNKEIDEQTKKILTYQSNVQ